MHKQASGGYLLFSQITPQKILCSIITNKNSILQQLHRKPFPCQAFEFCRNGFQAKNFEFTPDRDMVPLNQN
jgi:hypothetical protein